MKFKKTLFLLFISINIAHATEQSLLQTGIGVMHSNDIYKEVDSEFATFPLIRANYHDAYIAYSSLGYTLLKTSCMALSTEIGLGKTGYKSSDSSFLTNMSTRKQDIQTRVKLSYFIAEDLLELYYAHDFFNRHKGYEINLSYSKTLYKDDSQRATFKVGGELLDKNKSNYYFGVKSNEINPNRPFYEVKNSINPFCAFHYIYAINNKWSILASTQYKRFDENIYKSPIVEKKYTITSLLGIIYEW